MVSAYVTNLPARQWEWNTVLIFYSIKIYHQPSDLKEDTFLIL